MDRLGTSNSSRRGLRRASRLAKGYSLEDLAIATGLTVAEIVAAEEHGAELVPELHAERIEHALK